VTAPVDRASPVALWVIPVEEPSLDQLEFEAPLSPEERLRARRFRRRADYLQFACARRALREILAARLGCGPADIGFRYGPQGKPALASPVTTLEFNVSHAEGLAVVAISEGWPIGVDLEPESSTVRLGDALQSVLSAAEREWAVDAVGAGAARHLLINWTLKEAILKADGRGMSISPRDITLLPVVEEIVQSRTGTACEALSGKWCLCVLEPAPGYIAAVASGAPAIELSVHAR